MNLLSIKRKQVRIGVDVGGTFTDIFVLTPKKVYMAKVLNTPDDPIEGMLNGIGDGMSYLGVEFGDISEIMHGSTLGTNLLIERKGPITGVLTTEGFKDILKIQRQDKTDVYDLRYRKPAHLVSERCCFEVKERLNAKGEIVIPLDRDHLRNVVDDIKAAEVQSLAVCLLHSYKNDIHEKLVKQIVAEEAGEVAVSLSSSVLPQFREYERATATVINAYLSRPFGSYIRRLLTTLKDRGFSGELYLLQSNGGIISPSDIEDNALRLVLSGPSGGVAAAGYLAKQLNIQRMITLDMGGTSADVSVLVNGQAPMCYGKNFEGLPLHIPMLDIESIGAGGGSIAWIDKGGMLHVGPESAGANPGPACYRRGGDNPTVTDANVVVGLIRQQRPLGNIRLDADASHRVVGHIAHPLGLTVQEAAGAIRSIVNSNMEHAIRLVTSERGQEPADFILLSFGGAAPLHAAEVAQNLSIKTIVVPQNAGLFSALGCLTSDIKRDYVKTDISRLSKLAAKDLRRNFSELELKGLEDMQNYGFQRKHIQLHRSLDIRYLGQAYETNLSVSDIPSDIDALCTKFNHFHHEMYGRSSPDLEIEIVNYRLTAVGKIATANKKIFAHASNGQKDGYPQEGRIFFDGRMRDASFYHPAFLDPSTSVVGPAVVDDETSTIFVPPEWSAVADNFGNLIMKKDL